MLVGKEIGLNLNAKKLDAALLGECCCATIDGPRENDDKNRRRELTDHAVREAAPKSANSYRDNFFEVAYLISPKPARGIVSRGG